MKAFYFMIIIFSLKKQKSLLFLRLLQDLRSITPMDKRNYHTVIRDTAGCVLTLLHLSLKYISIPIVILFLLISFYN